MTVVDLYYVAGSPPCVSVQLTAKAVGVELNLKHTDLSKGEHLTPKFLALNPQHTVPTTVDGTVTLWESRAIIVYLAEKYDKSGKWYPSCTAKHAVVNQRLSFDQTLYQRFVDYYFPIHLEKKPANPELFKKLEAAVTFLNTFLENWTWFAGNEPTVADISLLSTITAFEAVNFDLTKYPNVLKWYTKAKTTIPGSDIRQTNFVQFRDFINQ